MSWRKFFAPPEPPAPPPMHVRLAPAPAPPPSLPLQAGDPIDDDLRNLWTQYRRNNPDAKWPAFLAALRAHNAALDTEIAKQTTYLNDYPPDRLYRP